MALYKILVPSTRNLLHHLPSICILIKKKLPQLATRRCGELQRPSLRPTSVVEETDEEGGEEGGENGRQEKDGKEAREDAEEEWEEGGRAFRDVVGCKLRNVGCE